MSEKLQFDFFHEALSNSGKRIEPSAVEYDTYLNRNESVYELDASVKEQVLNELASFQWKNYPMPYYPEIEKLIAQYSGVLPEQVAVAAGSASIITTFLNYFAANQRQVVIAQPSFSLYDFHCKTYNIAFDIWPLNSQLEYDISLLPALKPLSLVVFASPNNPVGNCIAVEQLKVLLKNNPQSLFIVDEVYNEFSTIQHVELVSEYNNLILLRSFSKVFSSAGLRAGYLIADKSIAEQIRKLILPFSLNLFSVAFLKYILSNSWIINIQKHRNQQIVKERDRLFMEIEKLPVGEDKFKVVPSYGNFVLIRFTEAKFYLRFLEAMEKLRIAVLDVSKTPLLNLSVRITIGHSSENDMVLRALHDIAIYDNELI